MAKPLKPQSGKVYVMDDGQGRVKIGRSGKPDERHKQICFSEGKSVALVFSTLHHQNAASLERQAQAHLRDKRLRGDWYAATPEEAISAVVKATQGQFASEAEPTRFDTFSMRADAEFLRRLDELRRREPDLPSRAEMVRRLVDAAFGPVSVAKSDN